MTTIETGGALWSQDGMYTISAHQGAASNYQTSADVEIVDGHVIPEFGTNRSNDTCSSNCINHHSYCKDQNLV